MNSLRRFFRDEDGTTAVEYAVMLAMIILTAFGAIAAFGQSNSGGWNKVQTEMEAHGVK